MKIIVTGALGHIGSQLIRYFPEIYHNVQITLLDNLATQRYSSLFNLPSTGNYKFIENDVLKVNLPQLIEDTDLVIHLAALTDATSSFDSPERIYQHNFTTTKFVAETCAKYHKPLFFPSSTSVYGPKITTIVDDTEPNKELQPQSPYAACKLKEEELLLKLHNEQQLSVAICRFGTIFGPSPGMRFHTAVNKFCWQAVLRQPVTVWETAYHQRRPYLSLQDAINIICFIIENNLFNGDIYNAVTSNHTVQEVIANIQTIVPAIEIQFIKSDIMNKFSFTVINKKLTVQGFEFVGKLQEGINQTIKLIKNINTLDPLFH
jgi:nucleoside-diphosphate-sugar epimerase